MLVPHEGLQVRLSERLSRRVGPKNECGSTMERDNKTKLNIAHTSAFDTKIELSSERYVCRSVYIMRQLYVPSLSTF